MHCESAPAKHKLFFSTCFPVHITVLQPCGDVWCLSHKSDLLTLPRCFMGGTEQCREVGEVCSTIVSCGNQLSPGLSQSVCNTAAPAFTPLKTRH